jgi:hypothetical protein
MGRSESGRSLYLIPQEETREIYHRDAERDMGIDYETKIKRRFSHLYILTSYCELSGVRRILSEIDENWKVIARNERVYSSPKLLDTFGYKSIVKNKKNDPRKASRRSLTPRQSITARGREPKSTATRITTNRNFYQVIELQQWQ